jgi:hypothetical protein
MASEPRLNEAPVEEAEHPCNRIWHYALSEADFSNEIQAEEVARSTDTDIETTNEILDSIVQYGWLTTTDSGYTRAVPEDAR